MQEMREEDVGREVVEEVGIWRVGVAEGAREEGGGAVAEVELAGSGVEMSVGGASQGVWMGMYIGVVIFSFRASSKGVSGWIRARRVNSTSVGMCSRELVISKMLAW